MKILYMKESALNYFKDNLETLYTNYFTQPDNSWMAEKYGSDPFETFVEIDDLELADPDVYVPGELEYENCKRLYLALRNLTPSQAADEKLWAGICNGVFYDYLKRRFKNYELHTKKKDLGEIKMRFFFADKGRSGVYSNSMAKWWWIGRATYDANSSNHFERLDVIGPTDFSTKVWIIFNSYTFSSNKTILNGVIDALRFLKENDIKISWKKEFRASMKYLNAYGGGVLLDSLSEEEIYRILLTKILELIKGEKQGLDFDSQDNDDIDTDEEELMDGEKSTFLLPESAEVFLNESSKKEIYVDYGDEVVVESRGDSKELPIYEIPLSKTELDKHPIAIVKHLLGRKANEIFLLNGREYIVKSICKAK